jgi:hypothetical protein
MGRGMVRVQRDAIMSEEYRKIVEKIEQSRVKGEIVRLLKDNPFIMDTAYGLSKWAVVPEDQVASEADELASMGVLKRYGEGEGAVYCFTPDEELREYVLGHWPEIEQALRARRAKER